MTSKNYHQLTRVPSGVRGLDDVLRGGFFGGGLYIIEGPPGAGKTILGIKFASIRHRREEKSSTSR